MNRQSFLLIVQAHFLRLSEGAPWNIFYNIVKLTRIEDSHLVFPFYVSWELKLATKLFWRNKSDFSIILSENWEITKHSGHPMCKYMEYSLSWYLVSTALVISCQKATFGFPSLSQFSFIQVYLTWALGALYCAGWCGDGFLTSHNTKENCRLLSPECLLSASPAAPHTHILQLSPRTHCPPVLFLSLSPVSTLFW